MPTCTSCGEKVKWLDYQAFTGNYGTVWLDVFLCPNHGQIIDTSNKITRESDEHPNLKRTAHR